MTEEFHKPGLYKWKRHTNPRVVSSSQRVRSKNDIENWIKKVEEASNTAAEVILGTKSISGRSRGKQSALLTKEEVRYQDEACSEAEELLNEWMNEKVLLNDDIDDEYISDVWKQKAIENNVRREWDDLLAHEDDPVSTRRIRREKSPDPYASLYNDDDDSDTVAAILQKMMNKDVIKETFKRDLGFEEKRTDPRMKMELRHKQVKENREKKEKQIESERRGKQAKKDAYLKAKQIILQEERDKDMKTKREELEVQKEMVKIRKQIQTDRMRKEEEKLKIEEEMLSTEMKHRNDLEKLRKEEEREVLQHQKSIEKRKKFVMKKMTEIQTKQASYNMRLVHQHFTAWYEVILQRRLILGKCRAMADWKLLLRAWNGWKSYTRSKKLDIEAKQHQQNLLQNHRKNQLAGNHYQTSLLQKYFTTWVIWIQQEQDQRQLEQAQNVTRHKMMFFLEKAATGQLWKDGETEEKTMKTNSKMNTSSGGSKSARQTSDNQKIDELFNQNGQNIPAIQNGPFSSKSESSLCKNKNNPSRVPTQAWQVTRKHLNLTNDEIASLGGGDVKTSSQYSDKSIRKRFGTQPWMNTHFVVNNFENRHTAQQKILNEQQNQLKEQKRLIEELQFHQNTQLYKKQLAGIDINGEITVRTDTCETTDTTRTNSAITAPSPRSICTSRSDKTESSTTTADTNLTKTSNYSKHSQIMKNMDDRAAERHRLKREREEKQRQIEEERLTRLSAEEEERKRQEENEKKARVESYRQKKKLEKQREIEKQQGMERIRELNTLADQHYIKSVIKYRGLIPMMKLVQISKNNIQIASNHHSSVILRKVTSSWHEHVKITMEEKKAMADEMRNFLLVKHSFSNWSRYKHLMKILEGRADRFRERNLKSKIVTVWLDYATEEKMSFWQKERQAKEHYIWYLQKKSLLAWKGLPDKLRMDKEKEKRKEQMRQKVSSLLPDFESVLRKSDNL